MTAENNPGSKILYHGYMVVTKYLTSMGPWQGKRGWSFKVMLADYTDIDGNYDWDQHEDTPGFYYCAWCSGKYFGDDEAAALEAGKKLVEAQIAKNVRSKYPIEGSDSGMEGN